MTSVGTAARAPVPAHGRKRTSMLDAPAEDAGAARGSHKQLASKARERALPVPKAGERVLLDPKAPRGPMGKFKVEHERLHSVIATLEEQLQASLEEKAAMVAAQQALAADPGNVAAKKDLAAFLKPQPFPTLRGEIKELQAKHRQLQERTLEVQAEHLKLQDAHKLLQTASDTKDVLVRNLKTEVDDFSILVGNLKRDVGQLTEMNSTHEAENRKLLDKQRDLEAENKKLELMLVERQAEVDDLQDTIEHDMSFLKTKASELSYLRTKWEDFANADEAWLRNVPLEHLRWLEEDGRKRGARVEAEIEARKLKIAAVEIENTPAAEEFKCVITQEVMSDPVSISDGHSYERAAIAKWFQERKLVSPQTNLPVDGTVTPNHALRKIITRALEAQVEAWKQQDPPHDPIPPNTAGDSVFHPVLHDKGFTLAPKDRPYVGQKRPRGQSPAYMRTWRRSRREGRPSASPEPEPTHSSGYTPGHSPPHSPRAGGAGRAGRWSPGLGDLAPASPRASPASPERVVLED